MNNKIPDPEETVIIGNWMLTNGSVIRDSVCERIQWLIDSYFEQISIDGDGWSSFYRNPEDNSYWKLTYPESHMHGGGPPKLERIKNTEV